MKIIKYLFCVVLLAVALMAVGKYYPILQAKWERERRLAAAEATYQRQIYLLKERQERAQSIPSVDPNASEAEAKIRWEAAKERGALPDQRASTGSTTTNPIQNVPNRR